MKVKELIEILEKMDQERKVMLFDDAYGEFYELNKKDVQENKIKEGVTFQ